MRTHFGATVAAVPFLREQLELVVGALLGDGTLLQTTAGYCFRAHHSVGQRALLDWKYQRLRDYVRTPPRVYGNRCYFRTVTHRQLTELRSRFYAGSRKVVPFDLLARYLTPLALATWIMDDGAADGGQVRLNTQSFSWSECHEIAMFMKQRFGITSTLNADKGLPRIRIASASMPRLRELVGPYILPEMRYKIPGA